MKIVSYILLLFAIVYIWFLISRPMTPHGHFEHLYLKYENQYNDILTYTSKCEDNRIMLVAANYGMKGKEQKCNEWLLKRAKCISLHPEYKDIHFKDVSGICKNRSEK